MIPLPSKDQQSANSANIGVHIKPVFQSKKIGQILTPKEKKVPSCKQSMCGLQISM